MTGISESTVYPMVPGNNLQAYLDSVQQIPVLSREQEKDLFLRFHSEDDLEAARTLVMAHLRFVVYIAKGYVGYGIPLEDLIQQGNVGLMRSVKKFESDRDVRLITFAVHWIKAEIHDYVLKNWKLVKVATTKAQRKLFFNLRKNKEKLGWMNRQETEQLASKLTVSADDVVEMDARLSLSDRSFHAASDDDYGAPETFLSLDESQDPALMVEQDELSRQHKVSMSAALAALDNRSRDIVESRWLQEEKTGLKALSERYAISMERVRQIEAAAFSKMQPFLK
jgi:RNA polymerase sigma-32 factor